MLKLIYNKKTKIKLKYLAKMTNTYYNYLQSFGTLNLSELNATSSFLKRIDRKYLLNGKQLSSILSYLKNDYQVLEIKGQKIFSYDNVYMDTNDYLFYNQHQNKQKSRTKVRTRYYTDSNLAFFEYKQKANGITRKYRYEFPSEEHGFMTKGKKRFFQGVWQSIYGDQKVPNITPAIKTKYKRITLVAKDGSERLTIDFDIKTINLREKKLNEVDLRNLVIIESKSLSKKSNSYNIMKKNNIKQATSCSKYSLGVIYSGLTKKFDTFKKTMKTIKEIRLDTLKNRKRAINGLKIIETKETYKKRKKDLVK